MALENFPKLIQRAGSDPGRESVANGGMATESITFVIEVEPVGGCDLTKCCPKSSGLHEIAPLTRGDGDNHHSAMIGGGEVGAKGAIDRVSEPLSFAVIDLEIR